MRLIILLLGFVFLGTGMTNPDLPDCKGNLLIQLTADIQAAPNPAELHKFFKDNPGSGFKAWEEIKKETAFLSNYTNTNLGEFIGEGTFKIVYVLSDDPSKVLAKLKENFSLEGLQQLINEYKHLKTAEGSGIPIVQIDGITIHDGTLGFIMKKYDGGLKFGEEIPFINITTIGDLKDIRAKILNDGIYISDVQFLKNGEGKVFLSDPLDIKINDPNGAASIINNNFDFLFAQSMDRFLENSLQVGVNYSASEILTIMDGIIDGNLFNTLFSKLDELRPVYDIKLVKNVDGTYSITN